MVKKRARVLRSGHSYTPASTRVFERAIAWCALGITRTQTPLPCELEAWFFIKQNWKGDSTNYLKALEDGLNETLYTDDDQLCDTHSHRRRRSAEEFIHFRFEYYTPDEAARCLPGIPTSPLPLPIPPRKNK